MKFLEKSHFLIFLLTQKIKQSMESKTAIHRKISKWEIIVGVNNFGLIIDIMK